MRDDVMGNFQSEWRVLDLKYLVFYILHTSINVKSPLGDRRITKPKSHCSRRSYQERSWQASGLEGASLIRLSYDYHKVISCKVIMDEPGLNNSTALRENR